MVKRSVVSANEATYGYRLRNSHRRSGWSISTKGPYGEKVACMLTLASGEISHEMPPPSSQFEMSYCLPKGSTVKLQNRRHGRFSIFFLVISKVTTQPPEQRRLSPPHIFAPGRKSDF